MRLELITPEESNLPANKSFDQGEEEAVLQVWDMKETQDVDEYNIFNRSKCWSKANVEMQTTKIASNRHAICFVSEILL